MKVEVLVDYYSLDTNRLDCKQIEVPENNDISLAIERPIDELTIYIEDENPLHIEYPYHSSAILQYTFIAMCYGKATKEEFEKFKEQEANYHNDCDVDKDFICEMIKKYVDFN